MSVFFIHWLMRSPECRLSTANRPKSLDDTIEGSCCMGAVILDNLRKLLQSVHLAARCAYETVHPKEPWQRNHVLLLAFPRMNIGNSRLLPRSIASPLPGSAGRLLPSIWNDTRIGSCSCRSLCHPRDQPEDDRQALDGHRPVLRRGRPVRRVPPSRLSCPRRQRYRPICSRNFHGKPRRGPVSARPH